MADQAATWGTWNKCKEQSRNMAGTGGPLWHLE
jgi:hypothetical protein